MGGACYTFAQQTKNTFSINLRKLKRFLGVKLTSYGKINFLLNFMFLWEFRTIQMFCRVLKSYGYSSFSIENQFRPGPTGGLKTAPRTPTSQGFTFQRTLNWNPESAHESLSPAKLLTHVQYLKNTVTNWQHNADLCIG